MRGAKRVKPRSACFRRAQQQGQGRGAGEGVGQDAAIGGFGASLSGHVHALDFVDVEDLEDAEDFEDDDDALPPNVSLQMDDRMVREGGGGRAGRAGGVQSEGVGGVAGGAVSQPPARPPPLPPPARGGRVSVVAADGDVARRGSEDEEEGDAEEAEGGGRFRDALSPAGAGEEEAAVQAAGELKWSPRGSGSSSGGSGEVTNMALGKAVKVSSNYDAKRPPTNATDGRTGARDWRSSVHTGANRQPWIEVDLGVQTHVRQVKVFNRHDCRSRLYNSWMLVSEHAMPEGEATLERARDAAVASCHIASDGAPGTAPSDYVVTWNCDAVGRFVRVQSAVDLAQPNVKSPEPGNCLALQQIEVFGTPALPALGTAARSTTAATTATTATTGTTATTAAVASSPCGRLAGSGAGEVSRVASAAPAAGALNVAKGEVLEEEGLGRVGGEGEGGERERGEREGGATAAAAGERQGKEDGAVGAGVKTEEERVLQVRCAAGFVPVTVVSRTPGMPVQIGLFGRLSRSLFFFDAYARLCHELQIL